MNDTRIKKILLGQKDDEGFGITKMVVEEFLKALGKLDTAEE